jgi:hypothetical protein
MNRAAAPLVLCTLVTLTLAACSTSSAIRSDSSPSFAAVQGALAQTGVEICNLSSSPGGRYCDHHTGHPSVAVVYADIPESFFSSTVSIAKVPDNSVWVNGRTIVAVPGPSQTVVAALSGNGFKRLPTGK